ncbi:MAG TPA: TauD/TfdA family dioxygenase [Verrucomicrobiae bacterium]|nr:TauD/TfdA family dioxygenase [Verrucomicrobiae bacterium]
MYKSLRAQTLHYFARPQERIPTAPLETAAAWRGADMRREPALWTAMLGPAEVEELQRAQAHAAASGRTLAQMTREDFPLPTLAARIAQWRDEIRHGRGFVLIRGVPVASWSERQAETFFWCLGHHFGMPGAQNPEGDLLGHVRDQRTGADVRYYRTNKELAVHTDTADFVGLLCLQKARSGGLSRIASSVAVFNELLRVKPHLVPRLFEPVWFDTKGEGGVRAFAIPPCRYWRGELRTFWQSDYYRTVTRHAHVPKPSALEQELLDSYDAIANSDAFHLDMDLAPGDVQLISNHTILHARTAFEDWPEPERRRHLLRLWISIPERKPLAERLVTLGSLAAVAGSAALELARERGRALRPGS